MNHCLIPEDMWEICQTQAKHSWNLSKRVTIYTHDIIFLLNWFSINSFLLPKHSHSTLFFAMRFYKSFHISVILPFSTLARTAGANRNAGSVPLTNMPWSSGLSPVSVHQQADRKGKTWTPTYMDQSHRSLCNMNTCRKWSVNDKYFIEDLLVLTFGFTSLLTVS